MQYILISLATIERVKEFVKIIERRVDIDFDVMVGNYVVDAKSIMGILTMNLSRPLTLCVHSDDQNVVEDIQEFLVA